LWKKENIFIKDIKSFTIQDTPLFVYLRVLNVTILDGWVIVCNKQLLKKLYCKSALADTSISNNNQFKGHKLVIIWRTCHPASESSAPSSLALASAYPVNSSNVPFGSANTCRMASCKVWLGRSCNDQSFLGKPVGIFSE